MQGTMSATGRYVVLSCVSCVKKILEIPISWKQCDPYSRPLGLGPRLVHDSDLELKKAERRGGSSWVTAGIPKSLPSVGKCWG